jgi:hypothetical protein
MTEIENKCDKNYERKRGIEKEGHRERKKERKERKTEKRKNQ